MREDSGSNSRFLAGWRPVLRDSQDVVRSSYVTATARASEAIANSGWLAGGVQQAISSIMGAGLRLNARPDTTVIDFDGLTNDKGEAIDADGWARFVERRWEVWSNTPRECDAVGRQTINQMCKAALKQWFRSGEICAIIPHRKLPGGISGTKVMLMQSHRLSQRTNGLENLVQGVRMDAYGVPIAYVFEERAFGSFMITYQEVKAVDAIGRPQVIHVFEGGPGEVRGISPLTPVIAVTRQYDQLSNATLTAAIIQTIFAATVESEVPTADFLQSLKSGAEQGLDGANLEAFLEATKGWASGTQFDLAEAGKINHLFPGEKLRFNKSEHPNGNYEAFAKFLLREEARCLGLTFEEFTGDYTGATYSSVRMSTAQNHQITLDRRKNIAGGFLQPVYEAWLEEEIEEGRIKFPGGLEGFLAVRASAARADWRGPPKPQADDVKMANTHRLYKQMGIMPDELIAADLGLDIEDVYEALRREQLMRDKNGIDIQLSPASMGIPGAPPIQGSAPGGKPDDGDGGAPDDKPVKPPAKPGGGGPGALDDLPDLPEA
jgi:lambda family phage portal protein